MKAGSSPLAIRRRKVFRLRPVRSQACRRPRETAQWRPRRCPLAVM